MCDDVDWDVGCWFGCVCGEWGVFDVSDVWGLECGVVVVRGRRRRDGGGGVVCGGCGDGG